MSRIEWVQVEDWSSLPTKCLCKRDVIRVAVYQCFEAMKSTGVDQETIVSNNAEFFEELEKVFKDCGHDPQPERLKKVQDLLKVPALV